MKILNSTPNPEQAYWRFYSYCSGTSMKGVAGTIISPYKGLTPAQHIIKTCVGPDGWGEEKWPYFFYIEHKNQDGSILVKHLYETPEDFPKRPGRYLTCPKCGMDLLVIEGSK